MAAGVILTGWRGPGDVLDPRRPGKPGLAGNGDRGRPDDVFYIYPIVIVLIGVPLFVPGWPVCHPAASAGSLG